MKPYISLALASLIGLTLNAKTITDIEGRKVDLPDNVEKVFGSSPPMTYLLYTLNSSKMIGLNFKAQNANNSADDVLLDKTFLTLPIIGSFHGGGQGINLENLMAKNPQLVLVWQDDMMVLNVRKEIEKTKIPYIMVPFREVTDMPTGIRLVGDAIGESKRAERLSSYAQNMISEVDKSVKKEPKTRYYYAEGLDGLSTECDKSFHVQAFNFAGGDNVHKCRQSGVLGLEKISFETILAYDPDVIIVQNQSVYDDLINDPMWKSLRAVKSGRIHLVPIKPFNWVDRPPSFMRVLGIQWAASKLHPNVYKPNLTKRTKEFFDLFLRVKIDDKQAKTILGNKQ